MEMVELYYDHYKDSFEQQKLYLQKRDKLTIVLFVCIILIIAFCYDANSVCENLNKLINSQVNELKFDLSFIKTGLFIITFWISIQYYQVVLTIEKHYKYIQDCEKCLSDSGLQISREGSSYLKNYPWLSDCAHLFYNWGIPLSLIVCSVYNTCLSLSLEFLCVCNIIVLFGILIFSILYISNRNFNEAYFSKELHPNMKFGQRLKMYFKG